MDDAEVQAFEAARPRLLGLAYRILGSHADAEDVVQDCFLKWREADRARIVVCGDCRDTGNAGACLPQARLEA